MSYTIRAIGEGSQQIQFVKLDKAGEIIAGSLVFAVTKQSDNNLLIQQTQAGQQNVTAASTITVQQHQPYRVVHSGSNPIALRSIHILCQIAYDIRNGYKKLSIAKHPIVKMLAHQIQADYELDAADKHRYRVCLGEFGLIIHLIPQGCDVIYVPSFSQETDLNSLRLSCNRAFVRTESDVFFVNKKEKKVIQFVRVDDDSWRRFDSTTGINKLLDGQCRRLDEEEIPPIAQLVSFHYPQDPAPSSPPPFKFINIYKDKTQQKLQIDQGHPIDFVIGQNTTSAAANTALPTLYQIAARAVTAPEFHIARRNYHLGRSILEALAAKHPKAGRTFFAGTLAVAGATFKIPAWLLAFMGLFSGFSMASQQPKNMTDWAMLILGGLGAAVFNYWGGLHFKGFSKDHIPSIVAGLLSAISPAILTFYGVQGFFQHDKLGKGARSGVDMLAAVSAFCNLFLSMALGTEGVQEVGGVTRDFLKTTHPIAAALIIISSALLAVILSIARTEAAFHFFLCPPSVNAAACATPSPSANSAKYWSATAGAGSMNAPEAAMFFMSYLSTYMRLRDAFLTKCGHQTWGEARENTTWSQIAAMIVAFSLGVSFFITFKNVGEAAWETNIKGITINQWFGDGSGQLAALISTDTSSDFGPHYLVGLAAALLIGFSGSTVHSFASAGADFFTKVYQRCRSTRGAGDDEESAPLIASSGSQAGSSESCFVWLKNWYRGYEDDSGEITIRV